MESGKFPGNRERKGVSGTDQKEIRNRKKDYLSEVTVLVSSKNFDTGRFVRELNALIYSEEIPPFFFLNIILDKKIASEDQEYAYRFYTDMVKEAFNQDGLFFETSAIVFFERDYQLFEEMGLTKETADRICDEVIGMTGAYPSEHDKVISEISEPVQQ